MKLMYLVRIAYLSETDKRVVLAAVRGVVDAAARPLRSFSVGSRTHRGLVRKSFQRYLPDFGRRSLD
jgi:hypothetical protein